MAHAVFIGVVYLLFFLSGAAALVYQVVWVRSLTLVFGGSHLAVTAVLSIFMGGLALGGYLAGRRVDRVRDPLRLYGLMELGVAASALLFAGLMKVYPGVYVALAQGRDDSPVYLTTVRMFFSIAALIVPTTLMGGTLPVLSRFAARRPEGLRRHLSFLYGLNTLGAVVGAVTAGFFLLRLYSVSTTLYVAVAVNTIIGVLSLGLSRRPAGDGAAPERGAAPAAAPGGTASGASKADAAGRRLPTALVLWGIGVSGFCALGYEVLWTRVLTIAVGASTYGFSVILVAFLIGIALGSKGYGLLSAALRPTAGPTRAPVGWFGVTQVIIGVTALAVTVYLRDIPANAIQLQNYFGGTGPASFQARVWAGFALAIVYMAVPAAFMGAAFPIAGEVLADARRAVGRAVGDVLAANTVGAILGAAVSGLIMIRALGIERSLLALTVVNVGLGAAVLASLGRRRWPLAATLVCTLGAVAFLAANPAAGVWDRKYFAVFRSNQPEAFSTPEKVKEAVENTDVLYYAEGVESIVSVIKVKGGEQAFVTNGRVEASSHPQARQIQYTLGHLPMLLCRNPKDVLVVAMGSGMTAGATTVHPGVERVTMVEIEPQVVGVARTFSAYNHRFLDDPKVRVVFNDGRNFLLTTPGKFDVITADPIHPWFRGAGYLYASEYFALAASHLRPGGVVAQWLPIYELTPQDLASVVRTFQRHFPHTMMWLTHYDAALVGSNAPFLVDEAELERRLSEPAIASDLRPVNMGTATDFLSYFVMGTDGMRRFGENGVLNTDDRLYLEFSAPFSIATPSVMAANVEAISRQRESLLPYLKRASGEGEREAQGKRWDDQLAAAKIADPALAALLGRGPGDAGVRRALYRLNLEYPWYAPGRAMWMEYQAGLAMEPRLLDQGSFTFAQPNGSPLVVDVSAVLVPVSGTRASVVFVDNSERTVFGQRYLDDYDRDGRGRRFAAEVMGAVQSVYAREAASARARNLGLPPAAATLDRMKAAIRAKVADGGSGR